MYNLLFVDGQQNILNDEFSFRPRGLVTFMAYGLPGSLELEDEKPKTQTEKDTKCLDCVQTDWLLALQTIRQDKTSTSVLVLTRAPWLVHIVAGIP